MTHEESNRITRLILNGITAVGALAICIIAVPVALAGKAPIVTWTFAGFGAVILVYSIVRLFMKD